MGFYDTREGINKYLEIAEGYDGAALIELLGGQLPPGSTVLELGMGPGKDLDILARDYVVTGSDSAPLFLELYREMHPDADLLQLDAVTIETERRFDCIYSNKVLHHVPRDLLARSLERQAGVLEQGGLVMHSFWYGDRPDEEIEGLLFVYYTDEQLAQAVSGAGFEVIAMNRYQELEEGDSIYLIARRIS